MLWVIALRRPLRLLLAGYHRIVDFDQQLLDEHQSPDTVGRLLEIAAIVEQNGAWDGVGTLSGGVVTLIMGVDPPPPADPLRSLIVGTFRGGDRLFENGFD